MRKLLLLGLLSLLVLPAVGQIHLLTNKEMRALLGDDDDKSKSDKWSETAAKFSVTNPLVDDSLLVSKKSYDIPGRSKDQIFNSLLNFFKTFYSDKQCVLGFQDKDMGIISATAETESIAGEFAVYYGMDVHLNYLLKAQVADGKVEFTYTLTSLTYLQAKGFVATEKLIALNTVYPYDSNQSLHKRASSKAIMTSEALRDFLFETLYKCAQDGTMPPFKGKKKKK